MESLLPRGVAQVLEQLHGDTRAGLQPDFLRAVEEDDQEAVNKVGAIPYTFRLSL